ncbi:uncharacterized protein LAESUDRAFT_426546 [Laetiporus sulphureus 93-53]|uniref:Uncharacterized protein n=1 Tax=Laetiporus sulphureus 93-53 TaxID=1314785 RepID=A0A165GK94_9APHY|nr:uncharacterized protein LAESUDRAFT_426546 [Laetiporus sulphureus 93-53]KZT10469.1 hypothetical protein LAESUDRAFT_426546 [Laetiporus sulphureus 93-53]
MNVFFLIEFGRITPSDSPDLFLQQPPRALRKNEGKKLPKSTDSATTLNAVAPHTHCRRRLATDRRHH